LGNKDQINTTRLISRLYSTPPFPGYPSGHATGAQLQALYLVIFFLPMQRVFSNWRRIVADSRFDAGIHFRTDNETGLRNGREQLENYC
jgi:membrane-associated phospholipid phosphatase